MSERGTYTVGLLSKLNLIFFFRLFLFWTVCTVHVCSFDLTSSCAVVDVYLIQFCSSSLLNLVQLVSVSNLVFKRCFTRGFQFFLLNVQNSNAQSATCTVLHISRTICDVSNLSIYPSHKPWYCCICQLGRGSPLFITGDGWNVIFAYICQAWHDVCYSLYTFF